MDNPTPSFDEQVAQQAWLYYTTKGWTIPKIAQHLSQPVDTIRRTLKHTSTRFNGQVTEMAVEERIRQVTFYHTLIEELYEAWDKSKAGKKVMSRTVSRDEPPTIDGQAPVDLGKRVITKQDIIDSPGDTAYVSMIRSCLHDLRSLFSLHPDKKLRVSWREHVPPGYDAESLARQFAEMMVVQEQEQSGRFTDDK